MSLQYQDEEVESADAVDENLVPHAPLPIYTYAAIAGIVSVAATQLYAGLDYSIDAAAFDKPRFLAEREYWRLLTGATMHGSLVHLAMNSYALYSFGQIFETLANRAHLAIVLMLSAVAGFLLSLFFNPEGTSVGTSGGIVGLIGYLTIYAFRRRQFISREFRKSLLMNIGFLLIFGLVLYQVIDNYGHIGGLVAGAVYGLFQISGDPYVDPRNAGSAVSVAGLVSLGVFLASCAFAILVILRVV